VICEAFNPDHPNIPGLGKGEHVAHNNPMAGFGDLARIDTDMPPTHHLGGQRAGFEEPRVPQPFIKALFGRSFAQKDTRVFPGQHSQPGDKT